MSIDEVIEKALFDYCLAWRDRSYVIQDRIELGLRSAIKQHVAEAVEREREECAAVCQSIEDGEDDACSLARECVAAIRARAGKDVP